MCDKIAFKEVKHMILKRKIYNRLLEWKKESGKRALLIEGARRIGKSTIVEEFAKNEYKSYILIDFNHVSKLVLDAFENHASRLDDFFLILSMEYGRTLYRRESLIIFDEVQKYPHARELIKYLVADGRYDYIETGSLISIHENVKDITIPSEERRLAMYPLDFEEFCWAMGNDQLPEYLRQCFAEQLPPSGEIHKMAMFLFRQYMLVGGMPMSIIAYLEGQKSFAASDAEKRDILQLYREDIRKIDRKYQARVQSIFDQLPSFLSQHEKRVKISNIDPNGKAVQYEESFFWLADSMICNECFNCSDPQVGLALNEERSFIKCYMGDTGLLVSHAFVENEITENELYKNILYDRLNLNEGMLYENMIAQMLSANGHKLYFYTHYSEEKHRNDIEIDFIITNRSRLKEKIYPIEVKSSKRYSTVSLDRFNERFSGRIAGSYVIHPKEFRAEGSRVYLPAYMTFCL